MHRRIRHIFIAVLIGLTATSCASDARAPTPIIGDSAPVTAPPAATVGAPPSPTSPPIDTALATSTTIDSDADIDVTERCTEPPESIVSATLTDLRTAGATTPCVTPGAAVQLSALRGAYFTFEVDTTATQFENPAAGTSGWSVAVAIDLQDDEGRAERIIQLWTLADTGAYLVIESIEYLDTDDVVSHSEATVGAYLGHLTAGRFDDAAALLGEGGQNWDERFDLTALPELPTTGPELAAALQSWCDIGALCLQPSSISGRANLRGGSADVTAVWNVGGQQTSATFTAGTYEGAPEVTGLVPLTDVDNVAAIDVIARAADASTIVIQAADGQVIASTDGRLAIIPKPADSFAWSDGAFVYWQTRETDAAGQYMTTSTVADLAGNIVCEATGSIHLVRPIADGSYVASVERDDEATPTSAEYPIPNYAIDCATGNADPIAPRSFSGEGSGRSTKVVNGKTFTSYYDAEGNGDILNEAGDSINGDDYAAFHTLTPDASTVVYGDFSDSSSPHVTTTIKVRDTATAEVLWSVDLPRVFSTLDATATRVIVGLPPESGQYEPWSAHESLLAFDLATGQRIVDLPTSAGIIYLS